MSFCRPFSLSCPGYDGRRCAGILAAGLNHLESHHDLHKFSQLGRGLRTIFAAAHPSDIARDLDGRKNEAPGKAPPSKHQGKSRTAELTFDTARTAADLLGTAPICQDQRGPNPMDLMNVNGSEPPALRAVSPEDVLRFPLEHICRSLLGDSKDIPVLVTF